MFMGYRIKTERLKRKLSQEELGNMLGVSKVSISGYEKGTRTPTLEIFVKIISVLKVEPSYLLGMDYYTLDEKKNMVTISNQDIKIIDELKNHPILYNKICSNPKKTINTINRKMTKE